MFREMIRKKQQLSREECIAVLAQEPRGVLAVLGDDGYPYALPIDHWYCPEDGLIYFHCGQEGHKLDAIRRCNKVSFCVYDQGYRNPGDWALNIRSVIVFGRIQIVKNHCKAIEITRRFSFKYTSDQAYIEDEIRRYGDTVVCLALKPEQITGKLVKES